MPRISPYSAEDRRLYETSVALERERRELSRVIRDQVIERGVKRYQIANAIGASINTVARKMKDPLLFTEGELIRLKVLLGIRTSYSV